MDLATLRLHIGNEDTVPLKGVTPAEALILVAMHKDRAKKHPFVDLKVVGEAQVIDKPAEYDTDTGKELKPATFRKRTSAEEFARLKTKYHTKFIKPIFPSPATPLPETFAEAEKLWQEVSSTANEPGQAGNWTDEPGKVEEPIITKKAPASKP